MGRYLYLERLLNHPIGSAGNKNAFTSHLRVVSGIMMHPPPPLPIQVGGIVLVSEDKMSRGKWPLAVVKDVHTGRDGLERTATVKTEKGTFNRPVQRLHNLERVHYSAS